MKSEFQIEIMKCGMAYVSTKWLVQSSSSSLELLSVRPMSWVLLHSTQPQASVHDITFFQQEHLPPTQQPLRQLQLMNCKSAFGAGCWSIQWMDICDRQSHPSYDHVDLAYELPLPGNCAECRPRNLLVRHGNWEHLWLAANCRCVQSCCRTVCTELCPYLRVVSVQWAYEPSTSLLPFVVVTERLPFDFSHECTVMSG